MQLQEALRERLMAILRINPRSLAQLSREIGMNVTVFHNFWNMKKGVQIKTLMKIEHFLETQEIV